MEKMIKNKKKMGEKDYNYYYFFYYSQNKLVDTVLFNTNIIDVIKFTSLPVNAVRI